MSTAIVLDTETTGFSDDDRVIELCIARWSLDLPRIELRQEDLIAYHSFFNPGRVVPADVTKVTGITTEFLSDKPMFDSDVATCVHSIVAGAEAVIGYNIAFDKRMIDNELKRHGLTLTWPTLVCAKRVWDIYEPRPSRDLQNAYKRFVDPDGFADAHGARADTLATRDVIQYQLAEFHLQDKSWSDLDPEKQSWWGPTSHIKITDDGGLVTSFGKNAGRPVWEVDTGFWLWVTKKDFPEHVIMLALKVIEFASKFRGDELRDAVNTWATEYRSKIS